MERWAVLGLALPPVIAAECGVYRGEVLIREDEMILTIEDPPGTPYDIRGKAAGTFFQGRHVGQPGDVPVRAKWILLDDTYVGFWIEEGQEHLFRFRLPGSE